MSPLRLLALTVLATRSVTRRRRPARPGQRPAPAAPPSACCTVELSGQARARGRDYVVTLLGDGDGLALTRLGDMDRTMGEVPMHVVVRAADGTVLKERDRQVKLVVRMQAPGDGNWRLEADGRAPAGMPRLSLKGSLQAVNESVCILEGAGRLTFKPFGADKDDKPVSVRLAVKGLFTKDVKA